MSFDDEAENCEHMIFHELSASRTEVDESSFHHRKVRSSARNLHAPRTPWVQSALALIPLLAHVR